MPDQLCLDHRIERVDYQPALSIISYQLVSYTPN